MSRRSRFAHRPARRARWRRIPHPPRGLPLWLRVVLGALLVSAGAAVQPVVLQAQMSVSPDQDPISAPASSSGTTTFTLQTDDPNRAQNTLQLTCDGAVVSCSTDNSWVMIDSNDPVTVTVSYTTSGTAGQTGTITLSMTDQFTAETAEGSATLTVQSAAPRLTADHSTWYIDQNANTNYPWFHLANIGDTPATYTLTVACSGNVSGCSVRANPGEIAPGSSADVVVDYHSGPASGGNGTITLAATSPFGETSSRSLTVVPLSATVAVTPKNGSATVSSGAHTSASFTITDAGTATPVTYSLSCGYSGVVASCSVSPSVQVYAGSPQTVSVSYVASSAPAGGTGAVTLTATDNTGFNVYTDQGSYDVTALPLGGPVVSIGGASTAYRNPALCVADCLDATYAYSTPAYTSMDVARSLTIAYRSSLAHPLGTVVLDASDTTSNGARQMSVKLRHGGTQVTFTNGTTESFFTAAAGNNRLTVQYDASMISTGVVSDSAIVTEYLNDGTTRTTTVVVPTIVQNESASPLGGGWTVVGALRAYVQSNGDVLVVDGSGAASLYTKPASCAFDCTFAAPDGEFRSLTGPSSSTSGYTLRALDGTTAAIQSLGLVTSVVDRFGNATQYGYDSGSRLHTVTDPAGLVTTLTYGAQAGSGMIVLQSVSTPGGATSVIRVDASQNLTEIDDPDGSPAFLATYGSGHLLSTWHDHLVAGGYGDYFIDASNGWSVSYDGAQRVQSLVAPQVTADGAAVTPTMAFTSIESATVALPSAGNGTSSSPVAHVDTAGLRIRITNPRGYQTAYEVNRFGSPIRIEEPLGRTTMIGRNSAGDVTQVTKPSGDIVTYWYTGPDLAGTSDQYTGRTVRYESEPTYHEVTRVYGDVDSVWNYWSASGRLDSTRTGTSSRPVTSFGYDARGRLVRRIMPGGYVDSVHYAATGWQNTDTTIIAGRTSAQHFNSWGLVDQITDPAGYMTQTIYDALRRPQLVIGPRNDTTMYEYAGGYLTRATDAKHQVYQYVRNALGWTTQQIDPRSASTSFGYDRNGNITSSTNRRGQTITAAYDALDGMTSRTVDGMTTTYATDPLGRYVIGENGESVDTVKYDPAGRVSAEISVRNGYRFERASSYNIRDQRTQVAFTSQPWGWAVSSGYHYDAMGRLDTLTDMAGGKTVVRYDAMDRPDSTILPNGMNIGTPFANILRPTDLTYSNATVNTAVGASYAYGARGELTDRIMPPGGSSGREFDYDAEGELTGFATYTMQTGTCGPRPMPPDLPERRCDAAQKVYGSPAASYSWDLVGNPTHNRALIDTGNRLLRFGGDSLVFDADGNVVTRYRNGAVYQTFAWSALGQLTSVTTNGSTVSFGYDAFGRRVRKTMPGDVLWYVHDGENVWTLADGGGAHLISITASYPGVDQPHSIFQGGTISYYLQDVSGNVTGLVNNAGTLQNHYTYLPFGSADTTVETVTNSLRFAAREYDTETGLYYMRARYYDPNLGRFLSEDPVGLAGGVNPYVYAGNDPVNGSDPSGMDAEQSGSDRCHPQEVTACLHLTTVAVTGDGPSSWSYSIPTLMGHLGLGGNVSGDPGTMHGGGGGGNGGAASAPGKQAGLVSTVKLCARSAHNNWKILVACLVPFLDPSSFDRGNQTPPDVRAEVVAEEKRGDRRDTPPSASVFAVVTNAWLTDMIIRQANNFMAGVQSLRSIPSVLPPPISPVLWESAP